ncbi:MAG: hypothetical protein AAF358_16430 [Pseudomonadota bacterium]
MPLPSDDLSRRSMLRVFGTVGLGLLAQPVLASDHSPEPFTPKGLMKDLPEEAFSKPRAIFKQRGDFDLDDPAQLARARLKSIFSLDGSKSHVLRMSRSLICPPGKPAKTLVNELQYWYSFIELAKTDERSGEPSEVITHSVFTRVAVDPNTLAPKRTINVAETGETLYVPDTLFAASVKMDLLTGKEGRIDKGKTNSTVEAGPTLPYLRLGPDVVFLAKGGPKTEGPHQPQVDMSSWATPLDELMDETTAAATARYSFAGVGRKGLYAWAKSYGGSEETQILNHKTGIKTPTFDELPDAIKSIMTREYADRT